MVIYHFHFSGLLLLDSSFSL